MVERTSLVAGTSELSEMRQNFDIVINGGNRRLSANQVRQMLLEAYEVLFQEDEDFCIPRIDCHQITIGELNEA
jgi:hypothetical protein